MPTGTPDSRAEGACPNPVCEIVTPVIKNNKKDTQSLWSTRRHRCHPGGPPPSVGDATPGCAGRRPMFELMDDMMMRAPGARGKRCVGQQRDPRRDHDDPGGEGTWASAWGRAMQVTQSLPKGWRPE